MTAVVSGINGKFSREQGKDKPPSARVCRLHTEDADNEGADFSVSGENTMACIPVIMPRSWPPSVAVPG